jgi:hypothetical protein
MNDSWGHRIEITTYEHGAVAAALSGSAGT